MRHALDLSGPLTQRLLQRRLAGLELNDIWQILLRACHDIALYYGGTVVAGAVLGGAAGSLGAGAGAVPGAILGAGLGAKTGAWVLAWLGLKSLVEDLAQAVPQALRHYEDGLRQALQAHTDSLGQMQVAANSFAHGHVVVILAMLTALAAQLTRGGNGRQRLLQEIHDSARLGPRVAQWAVRHEEQLRAHPQLQPRPHPVAMSQPARETGPAMTPSQLRNVKEQPQTLPSWPPRPPAKGENAAELAGSIRSINAIGGTMNCVNCAVATDATLAGRSASALPGGPFRINVLEKFYGTNFGAPGPIGSVVEAVSAAGPGARGIVFGSRGSDVGHVFNVVNQNGVIRFLDGQTGRAASLDGFNTFQLLRTN